MDALIPFTTSGSLVDIVDSESTINSVLVEAFQRIHRCLAEQRRS
jgi:hypothetical protein